MVAVDSSRFDFGAVFVENLLAYKPSNDELRIGHAVVAMGVAISNRYACGRQLECGGSCFRLTGHDAPCLCVGDDDGPGSCPA